MADLRESILLVENDPIVSDLIARQTLESAGFNVQVVSDAASAFAQVQQSPPEVIIADLNLPGLSGKDLLVALASKRIQTPVIALAPQNGEVDILQTFRLGAADYLLWPLREAEIINAVERVLKQVHDRQERDLLGQQLQQTNKELARRVSELTSLSAIGKAVTSQTDQAALFNQILESAIKITQADLGWFLVREDRKKDFSLVAQRGLPHSLNAEINQVWDDGVSSLVAISGEALSLVGDPLKRFSISNLGKAALIVPVKAKRTVIGLMVVMHRKEIPFEEEEQHLLESIADYASISLVNARLFRVLEERARLQQDTAERAQASEGITNALLLAVKKEIQAPLQRAQSELERIARDPNLVWKENQRQYLFTLQDHLDYLHRLAEALQPLPVKHSGRAQGQFSVEELARECQKRLLSIAQYNRVDLRVELAPQSLTAMGDYNQLAAVMDGLVSNAIRHASPGGTVTIGVERESEHSVRVNVRDDGRGITRKKLKTLFVQNEDEEADDNCYFGGLGIGLPVIREIIERHHGRIWVESHEGEGSVFFFALPLVK